MEKKGEVIKPNMESKTSNNRTTEGLHAETGIIPLYWHFYPIPGINTAPA